WAPTSSCACTTPRTRAPMPNERTAKVGRAEPRRGLLRSPSVKPASQTPRPQSIHSTTVVAVRHRSQVAVAGDGQVSIGNTIVKAGARKVRKLYGDRVVAGFAGAAADAFALFARIAATLEDHRGQRRRPAGHAADEAGQPRAH